MKIKFTAQEVAAVKSFKTVFGAVTNGITAEVINLAATNKSVGAFMGVVGDASKKCKDAAEEINGSHNGPVIQVTYNEDGSVEVESDPVIVVEIMNITSQMMNDNAEHLTGMTVSGLTFFGHLGMYSRIGRMYNNKIKDLCNSVVRRVIGK